MALVASFQSSGSVGVSKRSKNLNSSQVGNSTSAAMRISGSHPDDSAFAAFSVLCASLGEVIAEVDVNPLVVTEAGAVAVDALLIPAVDSRDR